MPQPRYDAIVAGAGHNGLVAATILARSGLRVLVLERAERPGGAAVSITPWPGIDARLSRYSYLVSLFPRRLLAELGIGVELRRRRVSSYTPEGDGGVLVDTDGVHGAAPGEAGRLDTFYAPSSRIAKRVFDSLTEPLRSRAEFERLVGDDAAWEALFERPLSERIEAHLDTDVLRGVVATDALIGTFAALADPGLVQNRCFLFHVVGNGTGHWDVPVGGMGALTGSLERAAREAGAEILVRTEVTAIAGDGDTAEVTTADGTSYEARHVLAGFAPAVLDRLLGLASDEAPEGSQLKLNLLLRRLPRLRDTAVSPESAFAGTFHVAEGYENLGRAYAEAAAGAIPTRPPCEAYCHSLTDPSILGPELRAQGAHTLTVFGLHMPARLFADPGTHDAVKRDAVAATLGSLDDVLAEPIESCLMRTPDGEPCLEARTPVELEAELGLPRGHIFHRDLAWPFAEHDHEVGRWGVETALANVWVCGAGARRGGGVSGIPGHNAARAVLEAERRQGSA